MEIIRQSEGLTKKDIFRMSHGNNVTSIKDLEDGTEIYPEEYVLYNDINSKGEETEILAIKDKSGVLYACQSNTFKREFFDMVDEFSLDFSLIKISGETKNGRLFISCALN